MFGLLASAFMLGIMVAIPPGSVTIVAAQRTLRFGFRNGFVFQLGSCAADSFYIVLVFAGVASFIADNRILRSALWFASGALLAWMAFDSLRPRPAPRSGEDVIEGDDGAVRSSGFRETFLSGVGVTLLNPVTVVGWIALAGNFFLLKGGEIAGSPVRFLFVLAAMIAGVQAWFVPLLFAIGRTGAFLGDSVVRALVRASGVFLAILSCVAFWSLAKELIGG